MNDTTLPNPNLRLLWCDYKVLPANVWKHHQAAHPFWRLYWNHEAGATVWSGGERYMLTPSEILLIAPHTIISTSNETDLQHFYVHFQLLSASVDPKTRIALLPLNPALRELKDRAIGQINGASPLQLSFAVRALILTALLEIGMEENSGRDPRISKVLNSLEGRLGQALSNAKIARETGMSVSAFNRQFKREMGSSLQEYLKARRIARACRLLQESDGSIEEVAEAVGFCDRYHFSRVFKRLQGMGPAAFRQLHRDLRRL